MIDETFDLLLKFVHPRTKREYNIDFAKMVEKLMEGILRNGENVRKNTKKKEKYAEIYDETVEGNFVKIMEKALRALVYISIDGQIIPKMCQVAHFRLLYPFASDF